MLSIKASQNCAWFQKRLATYLVLTLFGLPAAAQSVTITSPASGSDSISAVRITASTTGWNSNYHLEVWDNNTKLGNVLSSSANAVYVLPNGSHSTSVNIVNSSGTKITGSTVSYTVEETCTTSSSVQCNMDQLGIDNQQNNCSPPQEDLWVANPCGSGVQGTGLPPTSTDIQAATESSPIPDANNTTLNAQSLHLSETQAANGYSNVIFKAEAPTSDWTSSTEDNWTLDAYVYIPDVAAHQAFEIDAQYVSNDGVWTKFYTECAFNISSGTGYWAVYGGPTTPWVFLNGQQQKVNNVEITPPTVACDKSQFGPVWTGGPNQTNGQPFPGWHHIVWVFQRGTNGQAEGYPIFVSVTLDGTTTSLSNFAPAYQNSGTGESNKGDFAALVQLDGVSNPNPPNDYPNVDVYVNEFNLSHN